MAMKEVSREVFWETLYASPKDIIYPKSRIRFGENGYCKGFFEFRNTAETFGAVEDFSHGTVKKYFLEEV